MRHPADHRFVMVLCLALVAGACRSPDYARNRLYDTLDMMPASVSAGPAVYAGLRLTAFFGTAIGYADVDRAGWCRRTPDDPGGDLEPKLEWHEQAIGALFAWMRDGDPSPGAANFLFVYPDRGLFLALFRRPLRNERFDWGTLLDVEAELQLGVGVRVAVSPVQMIDWLLGWCGLDLLGDDVVTPPAEDSPQAQRGMETEALRARTTRRAGE